MNQKVILEIREKIAKNLSKVIIGKEDVIDLVIMALFCNGHMLIEDIPGTGKTVLAKSLALSISSEFKRIQFTPDMLPSDVTGVLPFQGEDTNADLVRC